ncbi:TPA: energy transducer TonB [Providencia rettgeri]
MTYLRFLYAMVVSLLLHGGLAYYSLLISSASAIKAAPIYATVMTITMTQFQLEQHITRVNETITDSGGVFNSPVELEYAAIKVARGPSDSHDQNHLGKTQLEVSKPKELAEVTLKKKNRLNKLEEKKRNDEVEQQFKAGDALVSSQERGLQGEQRTSAMGDESNNLRLNYLAKVRNELERHKRYPRRARAMGIEGFVVVNFQITPQGELINVSIIDSEYSEIFGKAVLNSVKRYRSVGPKPESVKALNQIKIHFSLEK